MTKAKGLTHLRSMALAIVAVIGLSCALTHPLRVFAADQASPGGDKAPGLGAATYQTQCAMCHGPNRAGNPPAFPSLVGVSTRLTDAQITDIIHNGRGSMPAQPKIEPAAVAAVIEYLKTSDLDSAPKDAPPKPGNRQ